MTTQYTVGDIQELVSKMEQVETDLQYFPQWQIMDEKGTSPTGVVDHGTLMERYQRAKQSYLHKRLQSFLVERVDTFDHQKPRHFDFPTVSEEAEVQQQHQRAVETLQRTVEGIHHQVGHLRDTYQDIVTSRTELKCVIQDMEDDNSNMVVEQDYIDDGDCVFEDDTTVGGDYTSVDSTHIEELQRKKKQLQDHLSSIQKEKEQLAHTAKEKHHNLVLLHQETAGLDKEKLEARVQELKEIKVFYDSLREVLEELGGVKILAVKEDSKSQHMILHVLLYDEFQVQIVLEVHHQSELKLVSAQWVSEPEVCDSCPTQTSCPFSLSMSPLNDLVEVAKTNLSPPHDVRFIVRETCARIRINKNRVHDLSSLRQEVLTKIVGSDQVVCSLNDGIVIVMRFYDNLVRAEQIVGVSGWDAGITDKILSIVRQGESDSLTPSLIVQMVRQEVEKLKLEGKNPRTPFLPKRRDAEHGIVMK